ncbi:unnamed protein product [Amoebophrya sp. A120]|nr:unnamed protein product [Amoebophrya sp. A120]|eukprot:GSA120T00002159001.1
MLDDEYLIGDKEDAAPAPKAKAKAKVRAKRQPKRAQATPTSTPAVGTQQSSQQPDSAQLPTGDSQVMSQSRRGTTKEQLTVVLEICTLVPEAFTREIKDAKFRSSVQSLGEFSIQEQASPFPFAFLRTSWDYASAMDAVFGDASSVKNKSSSKTTPGGKQPAEQRQEIIQQDSYDPRLPCVMGFFDRTVRNATDAQLRELMENLKKMQIQRRAARAVLVVKSDDRSTDYVAEGLVLHDLDMIEVSSLSEAGSYVLVAVEAVLKSKNKKTATGEFHHRAEGCKSVPTNVEGIGAMYGNWCSMLMEIPGLGEEMAKVVAENFKTPPLLVSAILQDEARAYGNVLKQLENLLVPQRGKNETRRLGPALANRIVQFFASDDPEEIIAG